MIFKSDFFILNVYLCITSIVPIVFLEIIMHQELNEMKQKQNKMQCYAIKYGLNDSPFNVMQSLIYCNKKTQISIIQRKKPFRKLLCRLYVLGKGKLSKIRALMYCFSLWKEQSNRDDLEVFRCTVCWANVK